MDHYFIRAGNYWLKLSFRWLCLWLIFSLLSGVLFAVAPVQKVAAADICSTKGGEDWSQLSTWDCGHVPTRDDDVFIENALSIPAGGATAFAHSITGNSGMLSVHGELDIYGDITLNDNSPLESTDGKVVLAGGNQTITISPNGAFAAFHDLTMDVAIIKAENLGISPPFNLNVSNLDALHSIFVSGQLTIRGGTAPAEYINLNKSGSSGSLQWYLSTGISVITDVDYVNVSNAYHEGTPIIFYHGSVDNNSSGWEMNMTPVVTSVDLQSSLTLSHFGQTVTFTATITPHGATGSVSFSDGVDIICADQPVSTGIAICDVSELEFGTHSIVASFVGTDNYGTSSSDPLIQEVDLALSSDAALSDLSLSQGTLDPVFATGTTLYAATVAYDVKSITVTATPNDSNAHASFSPGSLVPLVFGSNQITVTVIAEDGETQKVYTILVKQDAPPASTDANLASLEVYAGSSLVALNPEFSTDTLLYMADVENGVTAVTLTPTTRENHATVAMTDGSSIPLTNPVNLTTGLNTILIIVTAQDGV
ncbi:MAG TPA: cadherin-like beta sandwich domain-containing protein, partial [Anaerolineaceae bacterium]